MEEERVEADILCVGGGIAGLMAAIRAAELGARVVMAEKANTLRSGAGATGNDHFNCYIPEFHGPDIEPVIEECQLSQIGGMLPRDVLRIWMEKSFDIIKLWDSWGIPMKYRGKWEFAGHTFPGRPFTTLKYSGREQKPILTQEALKRGVKVINRTTVFDLFRDDSGIIGAIGVSTREEKVITFQVKSVFLGTGKCVRLYPGATPGWMFNMAHLPATTGDGRAMAYRAGAELVNMEMPRRHAGPKYFARCGKATWVGVLRDPQDKVMGPFVTKPDRRYGDVAADVWTTMFEDYAKSARGPVYMDCRGISDDDLDYMTYWLEHEGNVALLNHVKEEGIDFRKNAVEFMTYSMFVRGGICHNGKGETSVKGLYADGDELGGGISNAATLGWIAGENMAKYAKDAKPPRIERVSRQIEEKNSLLDELRRREVGAHWQEVNVALQQMMSDYAGSLRSGTMLTAGLSHLKRLKAQAYNTMIASNQHELMHCLEVLNLLDIGELIFTASLERKETRGNFIRADYPFTNPLMNNKWLICKRTGDRPIFEWR